MSTVEKRIQEAFDAVTMPPGLKESTLAAVEQFERTKQEEQAHRFRQDDVQQTVVRTEHRPNESIIVKRRVKSPVSRRLGIALAACLLLCALGFGGFSAYASETAQVGLEVNPSIELGVNRFDIVVSTHAVNEDGRQVLDAVEVVGKSYQQALDDITKSDVFLSYIGEDSFLDINVVCSDERQAETLVLQSDESIQALPCAGACTRVSAQERDAALEAGMGVQRYEAAQELIELDPSLDLEDCAHMSMKEIRERIAGLDSVNEYAHTPGQGNGRGRGNGPNGNYAQGMGGNKESNSEREIDFRGNSA